METLTFLKNDIRPKTFIVFCFFILSVFQASPLPAAPPQLTVSGNTLLHGGSCAKLRGVDCDGLEFSNTGEGPPGGNGGNTTTMASEAVTAWHSTIIRLPLNQDFWFGCGGANQANYQGYVSSVVNYCSGQGVYVILDLHWSGESSAASAPCGGGWGNAANTKQQAMADANGVTFWSSVAAAYANNPAVIFDLYNEPYDQGNDNPGTTDTTGYNTWLKGGTLGGASFSTPGMQALLNAVRATGANNVCLLGGLHWCANLAGLPASSVTNTGNGVMFAAHIYGTNDGFSSTNWTTDVPTALTNSYPVFVGEYGPDATCPPSSGDMSSFDSGFFTWIMNTSGIVGATAWSLTSGSCPDLISDWNFTSTSWGTDVKNFMLTPVPACSAGSPVPTPTITWTPTKTQTPTVTPTTIPPNITLTKTTGVPTSGYAENGTNIPMTIMVCNSAGSVTTNGVTVVDTVVNPLAWAQNGPNFSQWAVTVAGKSVTINPLNT